MPLAESLLPLTLTSSNSRQSYSLPDDHSLLGPALSPIIRARYSAHQGAPDREMDLLSIGLSALVLCTTIQPVSANSPQMFVTSCLRNVDAQIIGKVLKEPLTSAVDIRMERIS